MWEEGAVRSSVRGEQLRAKIEERGGGLTGG
jgi:hypothetical protein